MPHQLSATGLPNQLSATWLPKRPLINHPQAGFIEAA